jgi:hypothetical protein
MAKKVEKVESKAVKSASKKPRGLVLGHLERISSAVFVQFKQVITEMVGGKNGIYALYRNKRLYYVGLATNLKSRVNQHLKDRHAGRWTHFSLYLVRSEKHMKDLESLCLRIADPEGNRVVGTLAGAKNLQKAFKKKLLDEARKGVEAMMGGKTTPTPKKKGKPAKMVNAGKKAAATRNASDKNIPLAGILKDKTLRATYKGTTYRAWVKISGRIRLKLDGKTYDSPSAAGSAVRDGKSTNGWTFWTYKNDKGDWAELKTLKGKSAKMVKAGKKAPATRRASGKNIPLAGILKDKRLRATYKGVLYLAWVLSSGRIKLKLDGNIYDSPSAAGSAVKGGKATNGWRFWTYKDDKDQWVKINTLL